MLIALGHHLPGWRGPIPEGGEFNIDRVGVRLRLGYASPDPREIMGFRESDIRIALVKGGPNTLFFLFDIPDCTAGWSDASYALGLVHPEDRDIEHRGSDAGWLISLIMIDALTGIVCALRAATMTPAFSAELDKLVAEQRQNLSDHTREQHYAEIAACHLRWPRPADMIKDTIITETVGLKFQKFPTSGGQA